MAERSSSVAPASRGCGQKIKIKEAIAVKARKIV
jgi:hypothetical protein